MNIRLERPTHLSRATTCLGPPDIGLLEDEPREGPLEANARPRALYWPFWAHLLAADLSIGALPAEQRQPSPQEAVPPPRDLWRARRPRQVLPTWLGRAN